MEAVNTMTITGKVTKPKKDSKASKRSVTPTAKKPKTRITTGVPLEFPATPADLPLSQTFVGSVHLVGPVTVNLPFGVAVIGSGDTSTLQAGRGVSIVMATRRGLSGENIVQVLAPRGPAALVIDRLGPKSSLSMTF